MLLECGCTPKGAAQRMNLNGAARNQTLCDVPCGNGSWRFQNGTRLGDDGKEGFVAPKTAIIQSTIVHYLHSTRTRTRARETRGVVVLARKGNVHGGAQPAVTARAHVATRVWRWDVGRAVAIARSLQALVVLQPACVGFILRARTTPGATVVS